MQSENYHSCFAQEFLGVGKVKFSVNGYTARKMTGPGLDSVHLIPISSPVTHQLHRTKESHLREPKLVHVKLTDRVNAR